MGYLPLFVDDAQGWSRELPDVGGDLIILRTEAI